MTTGTGDSGAAPGADTLASDWRALRAEGDIQFTPLKPPERAEPPDWLEALFRFLAQALGPLASPLMWVAIAVGVALLALVLWQIIAPLVREPRAARGSRTSGAMICHSTRASSATPTAIATHISGYASGPSD